MNRRLTVLLLGVLLALAAPLAQAKKEGTHGSNKSPQHISEQGRSNANSQTMGQEKGRQRADERKSDQGLMHDQAGDKEKKGKKANKGKSKGHEK